MTETGKSTGAADTDATVTLPVADMLCSGLALTVCPASAAAWRPTSNPAGFAGACLRVPVCAQAKGALLPDFVIGLPLFPTARV